MNDAPHLLQKYAKKRRVPMRLLGLVSRYGAGGVLFLENGVYYRGGKVLKRFPYSKHFEVWYSQKE